MLGDTHRREHPAETAERLERQQVRDAVIEAAAWNYERYGDLSWREAPQDRKERDEQNA